MTKATDYGTIYDGDTQRPATKEEWDQAKRGAGEDGDFRLNGRVVVISGGPSLRGDILDAPRTMRDDEYDRIVKEWADARWRAGNLWHEDEATGLRAFDDARARYLPQLAALGYRVVLQGDAPIQIIDERA